MNKTIISILKFTLFLFIGLLFLWLAFRNVDLGEVWETIFGAKLGWILFSLAFGILSHISRAVRWNIMIKALGYKNPKHSISFYAVMVGYLANIAVPRMGEVVRCSVLTKKYGIPLNKLLGTVVSERAFDLLSLIIIIVLVIIFQFDRLGGFVNTKVVEPLFKNVEHQKGTFLLIVAIFIFVIATIIFLYKRFIPRFKENAQYKKIREITSGFVDGIKTIGRMKNKAWFLFHSLFIWIMYFLMTYVVFFALDITSHLKPEDGLTVLSMGSLGMVAPVPGGIGAYHFIVTALLNELFQISKEGAASFATLVHSSQTFLVLLFGVISYIALMFIKDKNIVETQQSSINNH